MDRRVGKRVFRPTKAGLRETDNRRIRGLPRRRSPAYTLIEFVLWFRLGKGIARKTFFIEKDGPGVVAFPLWGPRAGVILGG